MTYRFHWIVPKVLAGMAQPGASGSVRADLDFLHAQGVRGIVSLTERGLPEVPGARSFHLLHVPVRDFDVPTGDDLERFCDFVDRIARQGDATAVHCLAGLGRTGTFGACYLIHLYGLGGDEAIERVREIDSGYVQTAAQEQFVRQWAPAHGPDRGRR